MTDRPILFSGPMVNAILGGRKTQTRRVLNPQPDYVFRSVVDRRVTSMERKIGFTDGMEQRKTVPNPYAVGDRLYVREAWKAQRSYDDLSPSSMSGEECIYYIADGSEHSGRYRQGMHMPRWASRLTLVVTDVRVQRLQEISDVDAMSEGGSAEAYEIPLGEGYGESVCFHHGQKIHDDSESWFNSPKESFTDLWNSINDARGFGWDANPWVVAVTFETHKCNIDQTTPA